MRLLCLQLSDFRRYRGGPYTVQFDPRGTVLDGPNECGKSTLFEAIQHALFDKAKTSSAWVQRLVPYGTKGAAPTVTLELEHAGRTLRIHKRFGAKGEAELSENKGGAWCVLAKQEEAEDMLLQALGAQQAGGRAGASPDKWGALQWLLVPQELRELPEPGHDAASRIGLDRAGITPALESVWKLACARYEASFTATGKRASASEAARLKEELDELEKQRTAIDAQCQKLDGYAREHSELQDQIPVAQKNLEEARKERSVAEQSALDLSGAEGQLQALRAELASCEQNLKAASEVLRERTMREEAVRAADKNLQEARAELEKARIQHGVLHEQFEQSKAWATSEGDKVARLRRELSDAQHLIRVRELESKIEEAQTVLGAVLDLDGRLMEATRSYPGDPPDTKTMRALEKADAELRAARANLRNAALRVKVQGNAGWKVMVDGQPLEGSDGVALQSVVVQAEGGSILVEGDTSEARTFAEQAEKLDRTLSEGLSKSGVRSLLELQELRDERAERKAARDSLQAQRKAASPKTTAELQSRVLELQAEVAEADRVRAAEGAVAQHDALPDLALKKRAGELSAEVTSLERDFEEARKRRNGLEAELKQAEQAVTRAEGNDQVALAKVSSAGKELDRHRDAHGSTEKCAQAAADAQVAQEQKRNAAAALEQDIKRQKTALDSHRDAAVRKHDRLQETLHQLKARAQELQDQLERESAAGVYSAAAELERRIELGRDRLERLEVRDDAAALLHGLLDGVRSKAVKRVVAPIKDELDHLLAQVTRGRYTMAQLDDALLPRELEGEQSCKFEDGSQGLRELVAALVRLCVARHLAASGPQALVLDDPCVHVSKERTSILVEIVNQLTASGSVQAIILTHRGDEFYGLAGNVVKVKELQTEPRA